MNENNGNEEKAVNADSNILILAIECTAHTFGAAVVNADYAVLSNEKDILQDEKGGLIPIKIQEHHIEKSSKIIKDALKEAGKKISDIGFIAVSNSPGMGHALRVGNIIAKSISMKNRIPIFPVNHSSAHLTSAMISSHGSNTTLMYAAGANTQIYNYSKGKMMLVGETLDIGVGHLLDIVAREMGYGFPGGPKIEGMAKKCSDNSLIELPYNVKGMDIVFGGLFTKVKKLIESHKKGAIKNPDAVELTDYYNCISNSLQEYSFAALLEATERAAALNKSEFIGIIGGVALNGRFQEMAQKLCESRKATLIIPERSLLADNAAMIGIEAARIIRNNTINGNSQEEKSVSTGIKFSKGKMLRIEPYKRLGNNFTYDI